MAKTESPQPVAHLWHVRRTPACRDIQVIDGLTGHVVLDTSQKKAREIAVGILALLELKTPLQARMDAHTAPTGWPSPQTTAKVVVAAREVLAAYEAGRLT